MADTQEVLFAALGDRTRRELLVTLAESSPRTATQLAREFPITRQGIAKHLDMLAEAGLVQVYPAGREKRYSLDPTPLQDVSAWIESLGAKWEERLQRLKTLVEEEVGDNPD